MSRNLSYLIISLATFFAMQSVVIVLHEFTHSTMAWLLGEMPHPYTIVWGNPITMTGWDEGVDYQRILKAGHGVHAALTGISPLIMHSTAAGIAIHLMRGEWLPRHTWLFNAVYWLTVVNFMELIAYVYMRAFSGHGDVGNFDVGMGISPWWIFIFGSMALTWGLWLFYRHALPRLQALFAPGNPPLQWAILVLTSFLLFFWGSGIRIMAYVDDSQWLFGLMSFPLFGIAMYVFRPGQNSE